MESIGNGGDVNGVQLMCVIVFYPNPPGPGARDGEDSTEDNDPKDEVAQRKRGSGRRERRRS